MEGTKVSKAQLSSPCSLLFSALVVSLFLFDGVSCHSRYLSYHPGPHHKSGLFPGGSFPSDINRVGQREYPRYRSNVSPQTTDLNESRTAWNDEDHGIQNDFERLMKFQGGKEHPLRSYMKSPKHHSLKSKHHHVNHHHHESKMELNPPKKYNRELKEKHYQEKSNLHDASEVHLASKLAKQEPKRTHLIDIHQPDSLEKFSAEIKETDTSTPADTVDNEEHLPALEFHRNKPNAKQHYHLKHHKKADIKHHKHHYSKEHHYHNSKSYSEHDLKNEQSTKDQTVKTGRGVSRGLSVADIPELEGFVLQDYHEEDFRNIQPQLEDHPQEWKISDAGKSLVTKGGDAPILPDDNLQVGVEKFEDFDLTVFDVPSLTRYPKFYTNIKDDFSPIRERKPDEVSHKRNKKPLFYISTKLPNSSKHVKSPSISTKDGKHHIARRVGASPEGVATIQGKISVMNLEIDKSDKSMVSEDSRAENDGHGVKVLKSALVHKKFLTNKRFSHGNSSKNSSPVKSRSRREEGVGAPGLSGSREVYLKKQAEPLDWEAALANRNTEIEAEVGLEDKSTFVDILSEAYDVNVDEISEHDPPTVTTAVKEGDAHHRLSTLSSMVTTPLVGMPYINCTSADECSAVISAVCEKGACECPKDLPVFVTEVSSCFRRALLNTTCQYTEQCYQRDNYAFCSPKKICTCIKGFILKSHPSVGTNCVKKAVAGRGVDPAMIGVLVGLAVMFIIICVVLRLFSKARFRETRSIFNTPNPRLMNASLFKDRRRGSTVSTASGHVGTPGHGSARNGGGSAETPKASGGGGGGGSSTTPSKDKKEDTSVAIETVD